MPGGRGPRVSVAVDLQSAVVEAELHRFGNVFGRAPAQNDRTGRAAGGAWMRR